MQYEWDATASWTQETKPWKKQWNMNYVFHLSTTYSHIVIFFIHVRVYAIFHPNQVPHYIMVIIWKIHIWLEHEIISVFVQFKWEEKMIALCLNAFFASEQCVTDKRIIDVCTEN